MAALSFVGPLHFRFCLSGVAIQTPGFSGTSYISYPTIQDALQNVQLSLTFKADSLNDSILLYNAFKDDESADFVAILIKDNKVEFRYDLGSGTIRQNFIQNLCF